MTVGIRNVFGRFCLCGTAFSFAEKIEQYNLKKYKGKLQGGTLKLFPQGSTL